MLLRAVPEIILRGGTFFFRLLHPQDTQPWGQSPPIPRTRKCFNYPAPLWIKYALTLRTSYPSTPPTPRTHCQQNTLPPPDKKVSAPPQDNFWNSPKLLLPSLTDWDVTFWRHLTNREATHWYTQPSVFSILIRSLFTRRREQILQHHWGGGGLTLRRRLRSATSHVLWPST